MISTLRSKVHAHSIYMALAGLAICPCAVQAAQFESDTDFYASIGQSVFTQAHALRPNEPGVVQPGYDDFRFDQKRVLRIGRGQIRLGKLRIHTLSLPKLDAHAHLPLTMLDMPTSDAYYRADRALLCVDWALGNNGSGARLHAVAVIPLKRPQEAVGFAGEYANCSAVLEVQDDAGRRQLAWGVFDFTLISAYTADGGFFVLRGLSKQAPVIRRYQLRHQDDQYLLHFEAKRF